MDTFWLLAYIIAAAWMGYTYLGYPLLLRLQLRRLAPKAPPPDKNVVGHSTADLPDIAVVIVARHAAHQIGPKIRSCLDSRYPAERIHVLLAIDGEDEQTAQAAEALNDSRVTVLRHAQHRGKAASLNDAIMRCTQDILILTDARQRLDPHAIRFLVESLQHNPTMAAISGELRFEVPAGDFVGQGLDAYWRYEKWLRRTEGQVASTIGMTGALYALRRTAFRPIPAETILDDVLIPMQAVLDGHRTGFDGRAIAYDLPSTSMQQEKRRKIRTLAGNFQLLQLCPALINPRRNPAFLGFFSHKVCRLLTPLALLIMLLASLVLAPHSHLFQASLACAMSIIALATLAKVQPASRRWLPVRLSSTFIEMHLFIVYGLIEFLRNRNLHRWGG
ncbi:MAG: glycosyltransferase [Lautropia sp.]|nr:glycosyltransferase [Lautropia sp.]